ncbi:hypothetical protein EV421DRAFT_2037473 [Armillaria borealis]|uniref:Uncharacterized protein n=1 Tax=Armillaria borealis TaxID=47425 RepID=A0AA39MMB6_9AGAR|nr:hypothetical protein EV421DRAFT_2037473 [Armillaria borealis]
MAPVTHLFNLVVIAPSSESSDDAIKILQGAYHAVFGRNVPAEDSLVLWTQVCSSPEVPDSIVEELRHILPSLPDITWRNVARVTGLDPDERLSTKPAQTLYSPDKFVDELLYNALLRKYRSSKRRYVQLGSFAAKAVLNQLGFAYEVVLSEHAFKFEVKIVHNTALLMLESERWSDQTQVLAQALAEVTCLAASNRRLGYSFPIHIVITDLCETTLYTYDPSAQKLNVRGYLPVESFGCERDIDGDPTEVRERLLSRMTAVLARELFSLLMEAYHDYVQAKISLCPDTDTKACERALELIEEGRTLLSNRQGTQEERESGLQKLKISTQVLPWGKMRFTEEEIRMQNEEAYSITRSFAYFGTGVL